MLHHLCVQVVCYFVRVIYFVGQKKCVIPYYQTTAKGSTEKSTSYFFAQGLSINKVELQGFYFGYWYSNVVYRYALKHIFSALIFAQPKLENDVM